MSDNASYALKIAGGMLLGILLISLIGYSLDVSKPYLYTKEEVKRADEVAEFNAGFEAYDKKQMYGTDVISCMNKVYSQNIISRNWERSKGKFFSKSDAGIESNAIKMTVKLASPLNPSVDAYAYDPDLHTEVKVGAATAGYLLKSNVRLNETTQNPDEKKVLDSMGVGDYTIRDVLDINNLQSGMNEITITTAAGSEKKDKEVRDILQYPSITLTNLNFDEEDSRGKDLWTRVHITTYSGDLKKRIFKCTEIKYNEDPNHGRVGSICEMHFEEIGS